MNKIFIYITAFSILALSSFGVLAFQTLSFAQVDPGEVKDNLTQIKNEKSNKRNLPRLTYFYILPCNNLALKGIHSVKRLNMT